jgi:hypothetical protein
VSAEQGDYGPVRILAGPHKDRLGYYDDDLGSDRRPGKAIVYLGEPFVSDYILVQLADLESLFECAEKPQSRSEVVGC